MRRRSILQRGGVMPLFVIFLSASLFPISVPGLRSEAALIDELAVASPQNETVEERIYRVENGLLPPTVLKGEALTKMKLD